MVRVARDLQHTSLGCVSLLTSAVQVAAKLLTPENPTSWTVDHAARPLLPACANSLEHHYRTRIMTIMPLPRSDFTVGI